MYNKIINKESKISLIGLGYVGMPIAVAFSKKADVIGFDINNSKVEMYKKGIDPTKEVGDSAIKNSTVYFTSNVEDLKKADFHIVAVPTPLGSNNMPNLSPLKSATETVGKILKKGDYVVFESTVYPGVTDEVCIPILEKVSGLKIGVDFKVGYSPERINPGDKTHTLENITKVVSGNDNTALENISKVYELVVAAGVHKASTIKVAEAAKVIENAQRDINIAFMNELSKIFNLLNISTSEVLEAASTKWNFLNFKPGLVGGHCIGIDPFYLTFKSQEMGYQPDIILSGRKINDSMGKYIVDNIVKKLIQQKVDFSNAKIGILGLTFKENTPDIRNTKVIDIYNELIDFGIETIIHDPQADFNEVKDEYNVKLSNLNEFKNLDVVIVAVSHEEYLKISEKQMESFFGKSKVLIDIKGIFNSFSSSFDYWSL